MDDFLDLHYNCGIWNTLPQCSSRLLLIVSCLNFFYLAFAV